MAGVVQGSVIGPLLFIAYFDKVAKDHENKNSSVKYADDLLLIRPVNNLNDEIVLQNSIDAMVNAMEEKCLSFNPAKCRFSIVTESTVPYILNTPPRIGQSPIEYTTNLDYLGVTIDSKLTWQSNNDRKIAKAKKAIGCIRRAVKNKLPAVQMRKLIHGKVTPVFLYGLTVTYPRCKGGQLSLERLNKFAMHLSTNDYRSTYEDLLRRTQTQPVFQTVLHRRIQIMRKYRRGQRYLPPGNIQPLVQSNVLRHRYHDFAMRPNEQTGLRYRDSALELAIQVWNRLPDNLIGDNFGDIKTRLAKASYVDLQWSDCRAMVEAVLTL